MNENEEKEFIEKTLKTQINRVRKIFLGIGIGLTLLFAILGIILGIKIHPFFFFLCLFGAFFLIFSIAAYFLLPKKCNYDLYKKRREKYGYPNYYEKYAQLKEQNDELEKRISNLENKKDK